MIRCNRCGELKPTSEFYRNSATSRGYQYWCKPCAAAYDRTPTRIAQDVAYRKAHRPEALARARRAHLRKYGLTPETFDCLLSDLIGLAKESEKTLRAAIAYLAARLARVA